MLPILPKCWAQQLPEALTAHQDDAAEVDLLRFPLVHLRRANPSTIWLRECFTPISPDASQAHVASLRGGTLWIRGRAYPRDHSVDQAASPPATQPQNRYGVERAVSRLESRKGRPPARAHRRGGHRRDGPVAAAVAAVQRSGSETIRW